MKHIIAVLFLSFMFVVNPVHAETVSTVKENLIDSLSQSGYLDKNKTSDIKNKFITQEDSTRQVIANSASSESETTWHKYVTWINLFKVLGILLILIAMGKFVKKIVKQLLFVIVSIPLIIYQLIVLALSLTITFLPAEIPFLSSEKVYVVLLGALSNIAALAWIVSKNRKLCAVVQKFFGKDPILIVVKGGVFTMLYFGYFTLSLPSYIFGFLSVASFSVSITSLFIWGISKFKKTEIEEKDIILSSLFMHTLALVVYILSPLDLGYFDKGVQYIFSGIILSILIFNTVPEIGNKMKPFYIVYFTIITFLSLASYVYFDTKLISTLVFTGYYIFIFMQLAYYTFKANMIIGLMTVGLTLYGSALLLEKFGSYLVFYS